MYQVLMRSDVEKAVVLVQNTGHDMGSYKVQCVFSVRSQRHMIGLFLAAGNNFPTA